METWKTISGASNYEVSDLGRVRRSLNAPSHPNATPGRVMSARPDPSTGYCRVSIRGDDGKLMRAQAHRLVAYAFMSPARKGLQVNHLDGNKENNALKNLEWCTPQENVKHAWSTGLCTPSRGEKHGMAKVSDEMSIVIRDAASRGVSQKDIANVMNVTDACISSIVLGKTFKHTI